MYYVLGRGYARQDGRLGRTIHHSFGDAEGFLINPPDLRTNTQRIFVPRTALDSLTVLAVIGGTHRQRRRPEDQMQVPMFEP